MSDTAEALQSLIDRISNPNEDFTSRHLTSLSRLSDADAVRFQSAFLMSPASRRLQIISQIKHLAETDLVPDFSKIFLFSINDPDQFVRAQAALGLGLEENEQFITPLIHMLQNDPSEVARAAAAKSLGEFAVRGELQEISSHGTNAVYSALENTLLNQSESADVRNKALAAISFFSRQKIVEFIEEAYYSGDIAMKIVSIHAMGNTCDDRWLDVLLSEFSNENADVRMASVTACGEIGSDEAVPFLIDMVQDPETTVQEAAVHALGNIGGDEAKEALNTLMESPRKRIRTAAKTALEEIKFCEDPLSWTP